MKSFCMEENIAAFDALPYPNKVIFTHKAYPQFRPWISCFMGGNKRKQHRLQKRRKSRVKNIENRFAVGFSAIFLFAVLARIKYRMDHAVTAQKTILNTFGIDTSYIRKATAELTELLRKANERFGGICLQYYLWGEKKAEIPDS